MWIMLLHLHIIKTPDNDVDDAVIHLQFWLMGPQGLAVSNINESQLQTYES